MVYLTIDGMMSGTGIRDSVEGGYISPSVIGLSQSLQARITLWLTQYEEAHHRQYDDPQEVAELDTEGLSIVRIVRSELPESKVSYFSSAKMKMVTD
jgi:hypothetical protein